MKRRLTLRRQADAASGQMLDRNLVPLINVVFLMLIFFLMVGTLRAPDPVNIEPPQSMANTPLPGEPVRALVSAADEQIWLNGQPVAADELKASLANLWSSQSGAADQPQRRVEIRADYQVRFGLVRDILRAVNDSGATNVNLVTRR